MKRVTLGCVVVGGAPLCGGRSCRDVRGMVFRASDLGLVEPFVEGGLG